MKNCKTCMWCRYNGKNGKVFKCQVGEIKVGFNLYRLHGIFCNSYVLHTPERKREKDERRSI